MVGRHGWGLDGRARSRRWDPRPLPLLPLTTSTPYCRSTSPLASSRPHPVGISTATSTRDSRCLHRPADSLLADASLPSLHGRGTALGPSLGPSGASPNSFHLCQNPAVPKVSYASTVVADPISSTVGPRLRRRRGDGTLGRPSSPLDAPTPAGLGALPRRH